ncbi:MAG: proton-conducting transporter membrane subunit [Cyanobacteriota bacterium]|nr:proton-conducting transporter membrane subunit [Cyanobacteriota bacterium]
MIEPISPFSDPLALWLSAWLLFPFLAAFLAALRADLGKGLILLSCLGTAAVAGGCLPGDRATELSLLGELGVSLLVDRLAGWFLLLNALLFAAVVLEGWDRPQFQARPMLLLVLQGGLSVSFVATDLISWYVTLELVGVAAFLLVVLPQRDATLWVSLRYLLVSNTAMNLYLIGAGLIYVQQESFRLSALDGLPFGAPQVFLLIGLFTKAGVFVAGLWLPRTHSEAPAEISALLSGVVVTGGVVPLLRLAATDAVLFSAIRWVGMASAVLGVVYALNTGDAKRLLAWSTLSQMGLVVLSPLSGGAMALGHGLAKGALFLSARQFPTRDLKEWRSQALTAVPLAVVWLASLSIAGLPPLAGFAAKKQLDGALPGSWSSMVMLVSVGTVAVYARLWTVELERKPLPPRQAEPLLPRLLAFGLLLLPLGVGAELIAPTGSLAPTLLSTGLVFGAGLLLHRLLQPLRPLPLPMLERLDQLLGGAVMLGAGLLAAFTGGFA